MPRPEGELTFFQFVCPPERVGEVKALFQEKELGALDPQVQEGTRVLQSGTTGERFVTHGVIIEGIGREDKQEQILHELADRKIAGYSAETQILRSPAEYIGWGER